MTFGEYLQRYLLLVSVAILLTVDLTNKYPYYIPYVSMQLNTLSLAITYHYLEFLQLLSSLQPILVHKKCCSKYANIFKTLSNLIATSNIILLIRFCFFFIMSSTSTKDPDKQTVKLTCSECFEILPNLIIPTTVLAPPPA